MKKEDLKQYKMFSSRVKELTGYDADLYVFTFKQLQEVVNRNAVLPLVSKQSELLFAFIGWYADKFEMKFTDAFKTKLVDEFKSKL